VLQAYVTLGTYITYISLQSHVYTHYVYTDVHVSRMNEGTTMM